jgi:hypothetical protein
MASDHCTGSGLPTVVRFNSNSQEQAIAGLNIFMNNTNTVRDHNGDRGRKPSPSTSHISQNNKRRYEHYLALAQEKAAAGDRIEAENYYQHAEHYFRSASTASR